MSDMIDYKCPCCGGKVEFNSGTQNMKCPYCESEFSIEAIEQMQEDKIEDSTQMDWDTSAGTEWHEGETEGMKIYSCKSCGGEIIADELTGASNCPYCGNPIVLSGTFEGDLKPDLVIPFKLDKNKAKEKLLEHLKGKKFLPKEFKDQNHIDEIKGVYVPFWLFDADAEGDIQYEGIKERRWQDNNYRYVEKSYFDVRRTGSMQFEHVPVDGSSRMPDDLMESIEPFNYSEAVTFEKAYLSGYLADRYDVTAEQSIDRANKRVEESVIDTFRNSVTGYSYVNTNGKSIHLNNGKAQYVLYPVWILNTSWNGGKYLFAMNGQTGKFVGNLPLDKAAFTKAAILYATAGAIIACILTRLFLS